MSVSRSWERSSSALDWARFPAAEWEYDVNVQLRGRNYRRLVSDRSFLFFRWSLLTLASCPSSMTWDQKACKNSSVCVFHSVLGLMLMLSAESFAHGYTVRIFDRNSSCFIFQRRNGAEAIRRPSDPWDQLLWSQQDVLPLVQTVSFNSTPTYPDTDTTDRTWMLPVRCCREMSVFN